jgi:hypothetical protein
MVVYRAPNGNFNLFLNRLDNSIKSIYRANSNLILCGDINIDYLTENDRKRQLDSLLQTYNLTAIVTFPTRSQGISNTTTDNIFIDNSKISNYTVSPFFNGLSNHDAQLLIIKDINLQSQDHHVYITRNINNYSLNEFKISLSYELNARHPGVLLMTIKIYKYRQNTTDLLYSTTFGLHVSTP